MTFRSHYHRKLNMFGSDIRNYLTIARIKIILFAIAVLLILVCIRTLTGRFVPSDDLLSANPNCLGLCYQEFVHADILNFKPNGSDAIFNADKNLLPVTCRFHAVQLAVFTSESASKKLYGTYNIPGTVILQMRHDGLIGLPGGGVRNGESLINALYREIKEEIGTDLEEYKRRVQYLVSYSDSKRKYCGHLFGMDVSWITIQSILTRAVQIPDIGQENLGYFLMPSATEFVEGGKIDGLPNFLAQSISPRSPPKMVGNTLQEVIYVLTSASNPPILSKQSLENTIKLAQKLLDIVSQPGNNKNSLGGTNLDYFYE